MFIHFNNSIYNTDTIKFIDCNHYLAEGIITVHLAYRSEKVSGAEALDIIMRLCPAFIEGKRFKYLKFAWMIHNLIGHPLMQLCSLLGFLSLGLKIHDWTIPKPR